MAVGQTEMKGLWDAALFLDSHGKVAIDAVVVSVEVRHAPALLQLLATETKKPVGWKLARDQKLRHVARVSCEADVLLEVVVPLLKAEPRSAVGGRLLTRYAWSLRRLGLKVDGPSGAFFAAARADSNCFRRHASDLNDPKKGLPWLAQKLANVEERLRDLKRTVVSIPKVDSDEAEGDEEDPYEEEAEPDGNGDE